MLAERLRRYDDAHNFTCDICGREVFANERICSRCAPLLPWNNGTVCPLCGRKIKEEGVCLECKQKPLGAEKARSVFTYEGEAARLVIRFKRGAKYLYRTLCEQALPLLEREFSEAEAITFVPMTKKAQRKRGYNQSELLAKELARRSGKPFLECAVKKAETQSQKLLGRRERAHNLEGCFRAENRKAWEGKKLLIVDDTMTTGATVGELASVLKRAGAHSVFVLTIASVEYRDAFGKPPQTASSASRPSSAGKPEK